MTATQRLITEAAAMAQRGQNTEAYNLIVAAADFSPESSAALYHLGLGNQAARKYASAAVAFKRALDLAPENATARDLAAFELNVGYNLHLAGRTREGLPFVEKAAEHWPDWSLAWLDLSQMYATVGRLDDALRCARKAVDLDPTESRAQMSLAFALFANQMWGAGFAAYEARFRFKLPELLTIPYPRWTGQPVDTLFIQGEQGLGDTLMMMRYLPVACARAKRTIICVQKELKTLVESHVPQGVEVHGMPTVFPADADAWCAMMSLPLILQTTVGALAEDLSSRFKAPYISAPVNWDRDKKPSGFHVGIVWSGDPAHDLDHWRSIPFDVLMPLFEVPGVRWHSLQMGERAKDLNEGWHGLIKDHSGDITNMADTARIIAGLHLVITVDTAVAHLAGAMNKAVWLLVNGQGTDWRWGGTGESSPWYRSMTLFRKPLDDYTWHETVRGVADELDDMINSETGEP